MQDLLQILGGQHRQWCKMVSSFGCPQHLVEDIVQEMYIRMYKYVETPDKILYEGNEINTYYIYVTLRNMYIDYTKVKARLPIVHDHEITDSELTYDVSEQELLLKDLSDKVWKEVNEWHWYDNKMFEIYMNSDMSMRDISRETTISLRSIFNTIKNGKDRIKDRFNEDYKKYKDSL